jgi:hypothetical protein
VPVDRAPKLDRTRTEHVDFMRQGALRRVENASALVGPASVELLELGTLAYEGIWPFEQRLPQFVDRRGSRLCEQFVVPKTPAAKGRPHALELDLGLG